MINFSKFVLFCNFAFSILHYSKFFGNILDSLKISEISDIMAKTKSQYHRCLVHSAMHFAATVFKATAVNYSCKIAA